MLFIVFVYNTESQSALEKNEGNFKKILTNVGAILDNKPFCKCVCISTYKAIIKHIIDQFVFETITHLLKSKLKVAHPGEVKVQSEI